jgi:hypothetical protein
MSGMAIAIIVLLLSLLVSLVAAAIARSPLVRALSLSFDCWAERTRFDVGELS